VIPGGTIHGRQVPPGYSIVTVEQLELNFVRGDEEQTLGEGLHSCIQWRKAHIKLIGNTAAPVDPLSPPVPDNDDDGDFGGPSCRHHVTFRY
jgi:hypothetical protein